MTDPGFSPEANLQAGTRYLGDLMQLFDNRLDLVLVAPAVKTCPGRF